jgi:hypothetical protein
LPHQLGFRTICRKLQVTVCPQVAEWNRAEVLAARLLRGDPLNGPLGIEFPFEFRPDDGHRKESPPVRCRRVDLLGDADEVDVLFPDVLQEGKVIPLVA